MLSLLPVAFSGDDIVREVGYEPSVGVGFDHLEPGPHDLTLTLQAEGAGNQITYSNYYDPWGYSTWTGGGGQQQLHQWETAGVYAADVVTPIFEGSTTQPDDGTGMGSYFGVYVSHLNLNLQTAPGGQSNDETESTTGIGMGITYEGANLPATLPSGTNSGRTLSVSIYGGMGGTLYLEGMSGQVGVYQSTANGWELLDENTGIVVPGGTFGENFQVQTSNQFTGPVMLTARLEHADTNLDAADKVRVFYQEDGPPPPGPTLDMDVDSDNDNQGTQFRPPSRSQTEDDLETNPGMEMEIGEDWAKIEIHLENFEGTGWLSLAGLAGTGPGSFELADAEFNLLGNPQELIHNEYVDENTA